MSRCIDNCLCAECKKSRTQTALKLGQVPRLSLVAVAVKQALGIRVINRR